MSQKLLFLWMLLFPLFFFSCDTDEEEIEEQEEPGTNSGWNNSKPVSLNIYAFLRDSAGNDLLEPCREDWVNPDSIRIYAIRKGEIYWDYPDSATLSVNYKGIRSAYLFVDGPLEDGCRSCYVQWTKTWGDTLRGKMEVDNDMYLDTLYVNGRLAEKVSLLDASSNRQILFIRHD